MTHNSASSGCSSAATAERKLLPIYPLLCCFLADADPVSSLEYFLIDTVPSTPIRMSGKVCSLVPTGLLLILLSEFRKEMLVLFVSLSRRYLHTSPWGPFLCSDTKHVAPGHLGQVPSGEEKLLCCSFPALCCLPSCVRIQRSLRLK